jgi:hypothetical protein
MSTGRLGAGDTAIQPTILDAKADILTATAADTPARLAVGNNGETLVADGSTSTGLRWQSAVTGNGCINGGMDFWQRGTSFAGTTTNTYGPDRWIVYRNAAGSTFSRQTSGLEGFLYSTRIARDSGNTSTQTISINQMFESQESYKFAGKTVVLSWWAKAGANFSAASSQMTARIYTGTGTDQNWIQTGYTGQATTLDNLTTITTSWARYSASVAIPSTTTELAILLGFAPVGTAGANDWIEITGVQLEVGSVATTFKRAGGTLAGELAACQRYYYLHASGDQKFIGNDTYYATTSLWVPVQFPVTMRGTPTLSATSGTNYYRSDTAGASDFFNSFTIYLPSTTGAFIYNNSEAAGTAGNSGVVFTNNAAASVAFSAEL